MLSGGSEVKTFKNLVSKGATNPSKNSVSKYGKTIKPFGDTDGALAESKSHEVRRIDPLKGKFMDAFFDQYPGA